MQGITMAARTGEAPTPAVVVVVEAWQLLGGSWPGQKHGLLRAPGSPAKAGAEQRLGDGLMPPAQGLWLWPGGWRAAVPVGKAPEAKVGRGVRRARAARAVPQAGLR